MAETLYLQKILRDNNGAIIAVECRNSNGAVARINANDMREYINNGTYVVEGLEVNRRGLQDVRGRKQRQSSDDNTYRLILMELRDIKSKLSSQRNTDTNTELSNLSNQLSIISQANSEIGDALLPIGDYNILLSNISNKLDMIADMQRLNTAELKYGQEGILRKLQDLGVTNDEQFKELQNKVSYLFSGKTINGTIKYPKHSQDLNKDLVYYKKDITLNQQDFNDAMSKGQYYVDYDNNDRLVVDSDKNVIKSSVIFKLEYDEQIFKILRKHIEVVNNYRVSSEDAFKEDIDSEHYKGVNEREANEANAINSAYSYIVAAGLGSLAFPTVSLGTITVAALVTGASKLAKPAKGFKDAIVRGSGFESNTSKIKDFKGNGVGFFETRMTGMYNQFALTDVDTTKLLNTAEDSDAYSIDIRLFVLNCCGCLVKRGWKDNHKYYKNELQDDGTTKRISLSYSQIKKESKKRPYYDFVKNSLAITPIEHDERLFNFYCKFYLAKHTGVDTSNIYAQSQVGINSYKAYMDAFINAYFASKKSMIHVGIELLKILDDLDYILTSTSDIVLYGQFLLRIKICLVIQGIRAEKAEWLVHKFMHYDNTLNIYNGKLVQFRDKNMEYGYEVK